MSTESTINRKKRTVGILATLLFHSLLLLTFWVVTMGVHAYDTPKQRKEVLIAFEPPKEEMPKNISIFTTNKTNTVGETKMPVPRSGGARSSSQKAPKPVTTPGKVGNKASATPDKASTAPQLAKNTVPLTTSNGGNEYGDVERYDPEPEKVTPINPQALFNPSMVNDGGAPQQGATAPILSASVFKGGGDDTQTEKSSSTILGGMSFSLTGRTIVGQMPLPAYSQNLQGSVVVEISVDKDGRVTSARAGAPGSTVSDNILWNAARDAALKTRFTSSPTELVQYGTITYVFKLK